MKSWIRLFSPLRNIDSLIAACAGFYIIHIFSLHSGIGISPDSVTYISVARNLHSGNGLIAFDRMPLIQFPAFYPFFLESIQFFTHLDPVIFAPIVNGLLYGLLIYFSGAIMNGFTFYSSWYKWIILSCIVLSPCLLEIYSMIWSETLFLLFTLSFIPAFQYDYRTRTTGSLLLISLITALACITRYAGVTLIGAGALLLILDFRIPPARRLLRAAIFCVLSYSMLALNLARNAILSGTFTGIRQKGTTPLIRNLYYYGTTLCNWLPIQKGNHALALVIAMVCLAVFGYLLVIRIIHRRDPLSYENIAMVFGLVYSVFIILSATITRYQQLDSRLLSPLFIPLLWTLSYWIPPLVSKLTGRHRFGLITLALVLAIGFQYNQLIADAETYDGVKDAGIPGYTEDPWPDSQTVNFIKKNSSAFLPGYAIYSNAGDAVYFFTGLPSDLLPEKIFPIEINQFYEEENQYLVWFNDVDNPDMISLKDILQHKKMTCLSHLDDGAVYIYTRN